MDSTLAMPFKLIGKAIKPDAGEVTENVRSRSSVMRILERTA
jgi:16S rRNA C1402 N4-methylase RsmH